MAPVSGIVYYNLQGYPEADCIYVTGCPDSRVQKVYL